MTVSRADASAALADVQAAADRSTTLRGYQSAAPHLIIWGIAWALGYTVVDLAPVWTNLAWIGLGITATIADVAAARVDRPGGGHGGTIGLLFVIIFIFVGSTLAVMQPAEPKQVGAFIPLVAAAAYAIIGLMGAPRLLLLGAIMAALTLGGFFGLPAHFALWMAAVGGGSLVLGGVWLGKV